MLRDFRGLVALPRMRDITTYRLALAPNFMLRCSFERPLIDCRVPCDGPSFLGTVEYTDCPLILWVLHIQYWTPQNTDHVLCPIIHDPSIGYDGKVVSIRILNTD